MAAFCIFASPFFVQWSVAEKKHNSFLFAYKGVLEYKITKWHLLTYKSIISCITKYYKTQNPISALTNL